jgi:hypothetical protein
MTQTLRPPVERAINTRPARPRRAKRWWHWIRWPAVFGALGVIAVVIAVLTAMIVSRPDGHAAPLPAPSVPVPQVNNGGPSLLRARHLLGTPPSHGSWFSGIWAGGGTASTERVDSFGDWRGTPVDTATMYPEAQSWQTIHDSNWHITTYTGFDGVLNYGLPMLPDDGAGDFGSIVAGSHDWVYKRVAHDLVKAGRGRTIVRIGWEVNGDWFRWSASAHTAAQYVAAYRHIAVVLRSVAPDLIIDFDIACGRGLGGQSNRLDALTKLYPGDDVVDLVGCDTYDWYHTKAYDEASWSSSLQPADSAGIQDVANFARAHGKGLTIPEWGLASAREGGEDDNPFYLSRMRSFFAANDDILVVESYFSEPNTSIGNSIWDPDQNPSSSAVYAQLW